MQNSSEPAAESRVERHSGTLGTAFSDPYVKAVFSLVSTKTERARDLKIPVPSVPTPLTLLDLCRAVTGIRWGWYYGDKGTLGLEGCWQLMPEPHDEAGGAFWDFYLWNRRQWYDLKSVAVTRLLSAWFEFGRMKQSGP